LRLLLLLCAGLLAGIPARASVKEWTGAVNGYWNTAGNWNLISGTAGVPQNGDTLLFTGSAVVAKRLTTNNLPSTVRLDAISLSADQYALRGNALVISNGLTASQPSPGANTVDFTMTLGAAATFDCPNAGASLTLNGGLALGGYTVTFEGAGNTTQHGLIDGTGGLTKNGTGRLLLAGALNNTYAGRTTVTAGILELNDTAAATAMVPGDLAITGGQVLLSEANQIADVAAVTISGSGRLDLNNFSETIGTSLTLSSGGDVVTGTGTLTLSPNATVTFATASLAGNSVISGNLNVSSGTCRLAVGSAPLGGVLDITAVVSGSATLRKTGTGTLQLRGANTFTGQVNDEAGTLAIAHATALGTAAAGTTVSNTAVLRLYNDIAVTGEALTVASTYASGALWSSAGTNSWTAPIVLAVATSLEVATNSALDLIGAITGAGGFTKIGPGTLTLSGLNDNTYGGATVVAEGLLELNKSLGALQFWAIGDGSLTIGDDLGGVNEDVVRITGTSTDQINGNVPITLYGSGLLDLNGKLEATSSTMTFYGGDVATGVGQLGLYGNLAIGGSTNSAANISGKLFLGHATTTIDVADSSYDPDLSISAGISGGEIIKTGAGTLQFTGANTYTGLTQVRTGLLRINSNLALGTASAGTVVSNGAALWAEYGVDSISEPLTVAGSGPAGGYGLRLQGVLTWNTNLTLSGDTLIYCSDYDPSYTATINGAIGGPGGFTKIGPNPLVLAGNSANAYQGDTFVNEGELRLAKDTAIRYGTLTIGDGVGGADVDVVRYGADDAINSDVEIFIKETGYLNLNNYSDYVGPLNLLGGDIGTGTGTLQLAGNVKAWPNVPGDNSSDIAGQLELYGAPTRTFSVASNMTLSLNAAVVGTGSLLKTGLGNLYVWNSNSYAGLTLIGEGLCFLGHSHGLGTTNNGTVVSNSAALMISTALNVTNEALTLNGPAGPGARGYEPVFLWNNQTSIWNGPITLAADSAIASRDGLTRFEIRGRIDGAGGLRKVGAGALVLSGTTANTYAGVTRVEVGTLLLNKTAFDGAIPHDLIIGDGFGGANADVVRLLNGSQLDNANCNVTINSSGLFDLGPNLDRFNGLSGSGNMQFSAGGHAVAGAADASTTFSGVASGDGYIWKVGLGTLTLAGDNTYLRQTRVEGGTLLVNGDQPQSPVWVEDGATLGGRGIVGNILCDGSLAPGSSAGCLTGSNLTFTATGRHYAELLGTTPCTGYDQMVIRGAIGLANASLLLSALFPPAEPVSLGDRFVILNNDGADAVTGMFNGLPDGTEFNLGAYRYRINYGNDVVLTAVSLPINGAAATITTGNGNHAVDPNECNFLDLVVTNPAGAAMNNLSAVLSTTHPRALVTQPYSLYPNLPAAGRRTNTTPFQVSTLAAFPCGDDLPLQLALTTSTHGSFVVPVTLLSGSPAAAPVRWDNNTPVAIPDAGVIDMPVNLAGFVGPVMKVEVLFHITHTAVGDLTVSLIGPDGTTVELTSHNGGTADDYGTSCADAERTRFNDAARTSITAGSAPFVGTFRPEGSLAAFVGKRDAQVNGTWNLRVSDGTTGGVGTLRCWSLLLYPVACAEGGGFCAVCRPGLAGSIVPGDPVHADRVARDRTVASCGAPKAWPSVVSGTNYHYDVHTFPNTSGADACVTVQLQSSCNVQAVGYLNSFNPADLSQNYLGDAGYSTGSDAYGLNGPTAFSCTVPAGASLVVTVNEITPGAGCDLYDLFLSGLPCPTTPQLTITDLPGQPVRVAWPTWAGGFRLESEPGLTLPNWSVSATEPVVSNGVYNVIGEGVDPARFFRLHKP
jgi:autotransporter-associated beta strand protein